MQKQLAAKQAEVQSLEHQLEELGGRARTITNAIFDRKTQQATAAEQKQLSDLGQQAKDVQAKLDAANTAADQLQAKLGACAKDKCAPPPGTSTLPGGTPQRPPDGKTTPKAPPGGIGTTPGTSTTPAPARATCPVCADKLKELTAAEEDLAELTKSRNALREALNAAVLAGMPVEAQRWQEESILDGRAILKAADVRYLRSTLTACEKDSCKPPPTSGAIPPGPGVDEHGGFIPAPPPGPGTGFNPVPPTPGPPFERGPGDENPERQDIGGPNDAATCPDCTRTLNQLEAKKAELADLEKTRDAILWMMGSYIGARRAGLDEKINEVKGDIEKLQKELEACAKDKCPPPNDKYTSVIPGLRGGNRFPLPLVEKWNGTRWIIVVERTNNIIGNNPFDPQNPLGGFTPAIPGTPPPSVGCPQPAPAAFQVIPCDSPLVGTKTQTRTVVCGGTDWILGPWTTTTSTCMTPVPTTCSGPQPPPLTQTLSCPAGQVGSIIQTSTFSCIGTTWTPGPFTTTSNTCTTPPPPPPPPATGCATNFSTGNFACSGACGIGSTGLTVTSGSNTMLANPFGANTNVGFTCSGASASSQSTNLIILGLPGHSCTLTGMTLTSFSVFCRNNSGGTCTSTCSR